MKRNTLEDVLPPHLLDIDASDESHVPLSALEALSDHHGVTSLKSKQKHTLVAVASRMCGRALGLQRSPLHGQTLSLMLVRDEPGSCINCVLGTSSDQIDRVARVIGQDWAKLGARAWLVVVHWFHSPEWRCHLVGLMVDPCAGGRLVFYDPHGGESEVRAILMPLLAHVGARLGLSLSCAGCTASSHGIQTVLGGGLCAWFTCFVMTIAMLACRRGGKVAVHETIALLNDGADSPLVYRAFRKWATSALWVLTGRRHLGLGSPCTCVAAMRCVSRREAAPATRSRTGLSSTPLRSDLRGGGKTALTSASGRVRRRTRILRSSLGLTGRLEPPS
jgi:hypothetical protein